MWYASMHACIIDKYIFVYLLGCSDGGVRLEGGNTNLEGIRRVEFCYLGEWNRVLVCPDDGWDDVDASVVCRQFGFSNVG